jgi:tRNA(fMet)-specific endonuclease VapC
MNAVVVDTDVVSFLFKNDTRARAYARYLIEQTAVISFMTRAELEVWALQHNWGQERTDRLREHLKEFAMFPATEMLCRVWASIRDSRRRSGNPIGGADAWIAATAVMNGVPLLTHNARDFDSIDGLTVISHS